MESDENIMRIMVATDIHLGYNETHPIRGDDSFIAFEEILKKSKSLDVDFILLGGDLFHETRPSTTCMHRCISLLRRYCMGDKNVAIEFLSDQSLNFKHLTTPRVNYEDPNYNVSIPVFSIHGNHDDPTGPARLSALDILADIGLVNYFGKWTDLTHVSIVPLLLGKGETKLALYGLSHIRDERLSRLFAEKNVEMPKVQGDCFNLLALHQNRANRGPKNYIPEDVIPSFIDLVIWGHEHDCIIEPTSTRHGVQITQPGSSVATSLAEGESLKKHVGLLLVKGTEYQLKPLVLKTVRPFVFRQHNYNATESADKEETINKVTEIIDDMIQKSQGQLHDDEPKQPKLPLIRLVFNFYDEKQQFNAIRIGQTYVGKVANPEDMISLKFIKQTKRSGPRGLNEDDDEEIPNLVSEGPISEQLEKLLQNYMENHQKTPMTVLSVKAMVEATTRFLDNNDLGAFEDVMTFQCEKTVKKLEEKEIDELNIDASFEELRVQRVRSDAEDEEVARMLRDPHRKVTRYKDDEEGIEETDSDDSSLGLFAPNTTNNTTAPTRPPRGRGSRGPRRTRANRAQ